MRQSISSGSKAWLAHHIHRVWVCAERNQQSNALPPTSSRCVMKRSLAPLRRLRRVAVCQAQSRVRHVDRCRCGQATHSVPVDDCARSLQQHNTVQRPIASGEVQR